MSLLRRREGLRGWGRAQPALELSQGWAGAGEPALSPPRSPLWHGHAAGGQPSLSISKAAEQAFNTPGTSLSAARMGHAPSLAGFGCCSKRRVWELLPSHWAGLGTSVAALSGWRSSENQLSLCRDTAPEAAAHCGSPRLEELQPVRKAA